MSDMWQNDEKRPQQPTNDHPAARPPHGEWQRGVLRPDGTPYCAEALELLLEQVETYEKKDIPDWKPPNEV